MKVFKISSYSMSLILRIWAFLFAWSGLALYIFFGLSRYHLYLAFGCLLFAVPIFLFLSTVGDQFALFLFWGTNTPVDDEKRVATELDKVRHLYRKQDYRKANKVVRQILESFPDHGETLIWKAKVVFALDGDLNVAKSVLRKVVRNEKNVVQIKSWAKTLLKELEEMPSVENSGS